MLHTWNNACVVALQSKALMNTNNSNARKRKQTKYYIVSSSILALNEYIKVEMEIT